MKKDKNKKTKTNAKKHQENKLYGILSFQTCEIANLQKCCNNRFLGMSAFFKRTICHFGQQNI